MVAIVADLLLSRAAKVKRLSESSIHGIGNDFESVSLKGRQVRLSVISAGIHFLQAQ